SLTKRAKQLLSIEREYWLRRDATWVLVTPDLYHPYVDQNLKATAPWGISGEVSPQAQAVAVSIAKANSWASFSRIIELISARLGSHEQAQNAFWQAVWSGILPLDLR